MIWHDMQSLGVNPFTFFCFQSHWQGHLYQLYHTCSKPWTCWHGSVTGRHPACKKSRTSGKNHWSRLAGLNSGNRPVKQKQKVISQKSGHLYCRNSVIIVHCWQLLDEECRDISVDNLRPKSTLSHGKRLYYIRTQADAVRHVVSCQNI